MSLERMSNPSIEILEAGVDDLRQLVDLEEMVSMQTYPNEELGITSQDIAAIGWGEERVDKYRLRYLDNPEATIWVARDRSGVVGFTVANKEAGHCISKLYVSPDFQGNGIGSNLLSRAEAWLGGDQAISVGVATYDTKALHFYQKHGYEPSGLRSDDQTTVPATGQVIHEILLVKTVRPASGSSYVS